MKARIKVGSSLAGCLNQGLELRRGYIRRLTNEGTPIGRDSTERVLRLEGMPYLADRQRIEREVERPRDLGSDDHSAPSQSQHHRVRVAFVLERGLGAGRRPCGRRTA